MFVFFRWGMLVRVVKGKVMGESWSQWTNSVNVEDHAPIPGIAERVPVIAERVPERAKVMVANEEDRDLPKDRIDLMSNLIVMLISPLLFVDCTHLKPLYVTSMNCEFVELIPPPTQNGAFRLLSMLTWYERKNPSIENWSKSGLDMKILGQFDMLTWFSTLRYPCIIH